MKQARPWGPVTVALMTIACGGGQPQPERLSVADNLAEASRHEREAAEHERLYAQSRRAEGNPNFCYDQRTPFPPTDGEPARVLRPCWTREQRPSREQLEEAAADRREAARHRAVATSMLGAEREACSGLGEDEMSHSPFFHREDILRVEQVRVDGELHGARVVFGRVRGLGVGWLRRAIACHQARAAAMGYPQKEMRYCPLMAAPTTVTVEDLGETIAVTIIARRDWEIAAVVGRAESLLAPAARTPGR
jgi:hypothetical protein